MLKMLITGIVSFGLLAGCMTQQERRNQEAQQRTAQLGTFKHLCANDYGIKDNTLAMSACMRDLDKEASKSRGEWNQTLMRWGDWIEAQR